MQKVEVKHFIIYPFYLVYFEPCECITYFTKLKKIFLTLNTQDDVTIKDLFSTSETLIAIMNNNWFTGLFSEV